MRFLLMFFAFILLLIAVAFAVIAVPARILFAVFGLFANKLAGNNEGVNDCIDILSKWNRLK